MTKKQDERRSFSYHEAGHAVVAWSLGFRVSKVSIGMDGNDARHRARCRPSTEAFSSADNQPRRHGRRRPFRRAYELTRLCVGQRATVLQLPAAARPEPRENQATPEVCEPALSS